MLIRVLTLILMLTLVGAGLWQHQRYLRIRRDVLGDRQPLLYSGDTFHGLTLVKTGANESVIDEMRELRNLIETPGGGIVVYAGQVGAVAMASKQVSNDWSGLLLVQYPSRESYDEFSAGNAYREGVASFEDIYTHGVDRPVALNLLLVQGLGLLRISDFLRGAPSSFPFVPAGDGADPRLKEKLKELEQLDELRAISEDAVVIFNLIKPGDKAQRSADRAYTRKMLSGMAEGRYGPMHMGKAITIEGEADFDQFAAVYYPGIDFVQKMIGSTFMNRIAGGKQLGDSLALMTVPVLSRL